LSHSRIRRPVTSDTSSRAGPPTGSEKRNEDVPDAGFGHGAEKLRLPAIAPPAWTTASLPPARQDVR
jgi:hypothetical protein